MISLLLGAGVAMASSGTGNEQAIEGVLTLLFLMGAAYLLSHFVVDWLQQRFLFVSSVEYLVVGLALGQFAVFKNINLLAPFIAVAAGWVGLNHGFEANPARHLQSNDGSMRLAALQSSMAGALVTFGTRALLISILPQSPSEHIWLAALTLGCVAAAGSNSAIHLIQRKFNTDGKLVSTLKDTSTIADLLSIAAFGIVFCLFHTSLIPSSLPEPALTNAIHLGRSDWILITLALGIALGLIFSTFVGEDDSDNALFLAMVGIIALASGAAFMLDLSLITINLIMATVVANSFRERSGLEHTLQSTRGPMSLLLLIFAGALWRPPEGVGLHYSWLVVLFFVSTYVLLRFAGKLFGSWLAAFGTSMRSDLSRGLLAQGDEALAMAISLRLIYSGPAIDLAYSAILFSVMVNELMAPRILHSLLIDAGEIRPKATETDACTSS